jgi:hypothetical protein
MYAYIFLPVFTSSKQIDGLEILLRALSLSKKGEGASSLIPVRGAARVTNDQLSVQNDTARWFYAILDQVNQDFN